MASSWFDPHKSFLSLKIVWFTVVTLVSISIISAYVIIVNSSLEIELSFEGFNFFISVFRFPLAISALIIPIVALLAANHRSEQTKEQIRVTNAQNVFSNYYKHIEEFTKYMSDRVSKDFDLRFVHNKIYPSAASGDYEINQNLLSLLKQLDQLPHDLISNTPSDLKYEIAPELKDKYNQIIHDIYGFIYRDIDEYSLTTKGESKVLSTYLFESKLLLSNSLSAIEKLEKFCKFSIDYVSPIVLLDRKVFSLDDIYVMKRAPNERGLQLMGEKVDQTFEEASAKLIAMLTRSVERSKDTN